MGFADIVAPLLSGVIFGYALDKGKVSVPYTISQQMAMGNFTMMRMFLAASATATLSISILHNIGQYVRKPKEGKKLGLGILCGFGANILGGMLLGAGMYLGGACPGTVWPQTGASQSAQQLYVILGGLFGSLTFGYLHRHIKAILPKFQATTEVPFEDEPSKVNVLSFLMVLATAGAIVVLNGMFPWEEQLGKVLGSFNADQVFGAGSSDLFGSVAWDPLLAGIVVGLLQIPSILSMGNSFGSSSGWVYIVGNIAKAVDPKLETNSPYLHQAQKSVIGRWQALCALGAIVGGYASLHTSATAIPSSLVLSPFRAFTGGFCLLVGSRLGGGCTSGHGLSGIGTGSLASMITVCSMFIGGMTAALLVDPSTILHNLHLDTYV